MGQWIATNNTMLQKQRRTPQKEKNRRNSRVLYHLILSLFSRDFGVERAHTQPKTWPQHESDAVRIILLVVFFSCSCFFSLSLLLMGHHHILLLLSFYFFLCVQKKKKEISQESRRMKASIIRKREHWLKHNNEIIMFGRMKTGLTIEDQVLMCIGAGVYACVWWNIDLSMSQCHT